MGIVEEILEGQNVHRGYNEGCGKPDKIRM